MPWYLGRVRESAPGSGAKVEYEGYREISDDEIARVKTSIAVVVRLSPRALLMPLLRAADDVYSKLQEFQDKPAVRRDIDLQVERAIALDYWLNALPLFTYRLQRETRLVLGAAAETVLNRRLDGARENTLALRVSWLLRNAGQHALSPIHLLAVNSARANDGTSVRRTILDVDKWRDAVGVEFPKELESLPPTVDYLELVRDTVSACNKIMAHFQVDNAELREAASTHVIDVIGEALVHFDETSHVMIWLQEKSAGESYDWQFVELPFTYAGEVMLSTDRARTALGLPTKWEHLNVDRSEDPPDA